MDKKAVDLFTGAALVDFASVKDSMEYREVFSSMVTEYEKMIRQPLTHAAVDSLVNILGSDLDRFKDKRKRKSGIDARTFSQARNGVIPAPPWLFAAVCYLLGVRVKDKLQEIESKCKPTPLPMISPVPVPAQEIKVVQNITLIKSAQRNYKRIVLEVKDKHKALDAFIRLCDTDYLKHWRLCFEKENSAAAVFLCEIETDPNNYNYSDLSLYLDLLAS